METKTWIGIFLLVVVIIFFLAITWFFYSYWEQQPLPIIDPTPRPPSPPPNVVLETYCVQRSTRQGVPYYSMRFSEASCSSITPEFSFRAPREPIEGQTSPWCMEIIDRGFGNVIYMLYNRDTCTSLAGNNTVNVYTSSSFSPGLIPIYFYSSPNTGMHPSLVTLDERGLTLDGMGYIFPI